MGFLRWLGFAGGVDIFYGVGHYRYAILHPEWKTPWVATFVIWFFWNSFIVFIILLIISKSDLRELYLGDRISNLLLHESRRICVCMALPKKIR